MMLCLEEAGRSLWFHRRLVLPALVVMVVSLTVLGAFLLVMENLTGLLDSWRERGQLQIFLRDDFTDTQRRAIEAELRRNQAVEGYRFISPEAAAELFRSDFSELGEMLDLLEDNPLPASLAVTIVPSMRSERVLGVLAADLAEMAGVDGVQYDLQIIRRLELGVRGLRVVGLLLGGSVLLAAVVTTANVIRVLVVSRGHEIDTMRLVGASEVVILGRFLAEGVIQGTVAGCLAVLSLYVAYSLGLAYVDRGSIGFLSALAFGFLRPVSVIALVAGGALTGLLGSWFAFGPGGLRSEA